MAERPRIVVAGGGVAALEALLALRELTGPRAALELIAPGTVMLLRPASVAEPFGLGGPPPVQLAEVAAYCGARLHSATLAGVRPAEHRATTASGVEIPYDHLVVAVGARKADAIPGAVPFGGPSDVPALTRLLEAAEAGDVRTIAFVAPSAGGWTLPVYELALMAAADLRARGADTGISVITAEPAPLWLFGESAGEAIAELLAARGIRLLHGRATAFADGRVAMVEGQGHAAEAVVVIPPVQGPWIRDLAMDHQGFVKVDELGRVEDAEDVWAAGDATAFPIKQGGLACQQADTVATAIAAQLGAAAEPSPFRPVLRGLLLTGGAPLYLRAELDRRGAVRRRGVTGLRGEVSTRALWWPPGKVAGRYLAPYLSTARPRALGREPLVDRAATASGAAAGGTGDAFELALLLADADAAAGDFRQAVHALDAAAALSGGVLPAEAARRRDAWRPRLPARPRPSHIEIEEEP
ncbi:MAG TPA: FAD-dependent oxidoreductase [Solirubrobacteraceae bacterium]|nr:FAD-dependent oxidoreductase [Solirubrobacteraceae bacterium]